MNGIKRLFNFYLDASIHVALSVYCLSIVACNSLQIVTSVHVSWFLFFATIVCYNFIKYGVEASKYLVVATQYHKKIQVFSFIAFILMAYHAWFLPKPVWSVILTLILLVGVYAIPVLPKYKNLRNFGGLKIFIVALVWGGATVLLPFLATKILIFNGEVIVVFIRHFLLVLILLLPFEIRDLKYDDSALRTLPQVYGVQKTKFIGFFLTGIFYVSLFVKHIIAPNEILIDGIIMLLLFILIYKTKRAQEQYFASFWVESVPVIWFVLWMLLGE